MKKLALIALVLVFTGRCSGRVEQQRQPTDAAQNLVHALEQHNQRQMNNVLCTDALAGVSLSETEARMSFRNTTYTEQNRTDHTATVMITSEVGAGGNSGSTRITWLVTLDKRGRTWCGSSLSRADF